MNTARLVNHGGAYVAILPVIESETRSDRGALSGQKVAVKESVALAGFVRSAGSAALVDGPVEPADAWIVRRLRDSGAVICGHTAMHELAFGTTGINAYEGTPANPVDLGAIPGGSSSGSAVAVAEGSADLAVGSDSGGSVRIPSALCGIVGFKPAYGSYPLEGVVPLAPSLDHLGLHARTVTQIIRAHGALSGETATMPGALRLGVAAGQLEICEPEVAAAITAALSALTNAGHVLVPVELSSVERIQATSTTVMFYEAAKVFREILAHRASMLGGDVRARLETGATITSREYERARADQAFLRYETESTLSPFDAVLGPTLPLLGPSMELASADPGLGGRLVTFTRLANLTGHPAISLPIPAGSRPTGLQLVGTSNTRLLAAAAAIEAMVPSFRSGAA